VSALAIISVVLVVLVVLTSINTFRIWTGKEGFTLRATSQIYRLSPQYQRFMSLTAISTFVWWSFGLITCGRYGLREEHSTTVRALLYVPLSAGWILFALTVVFGVTIFSWGKPLRCIPPSFRKAARANWHQT
jgi:hypothetical protein